MLYKETKQDETTPKIRPSQLNRTSPKLPSIFGTIEEPYLPMIKPATTIMLALIAASEVRIPRIKYVNKIVKQTVRERTTFPVSKQISKKYLIKRNFDII